MILIMIYCILLLIVIYLPENICFDNIDGIKLYKT